MLPNSQGIETFDQLFEADPLIPIQTLSAQEDETRAKEAVQRGAQGNLSKGHFYSYRVAQSFYLEKAHADFVEGVQSSAKRVCRLTLRSWK